MGKGGVQGQKSAGQRAPRRRHSRIHKLSLTISCRNLGLSSNSNRKIHLVISFVGEPAGCCCGTARRLRDWRQTTLEKYYPAFKNEAKKIFSFKPQAPNVQQAPPAPQASPVQRLLTHYFRPIRPSKRTSS